MKGSGHFRFSLIDYKCRKRCVRIWFHFHQKLEGRNRSSSRFMSLVNNSQETPESCHKIGHIERQCTNKGNKNGKSLPRKPTKVKKFWCALHKDEKGKRWFSNSCSALRAMTDIQKRISLLKKWRLYTMLRRPQS